MSESIADYVKIFLSQLCKQCIPGRILYYVFFACYKVLFNYLKAICTIFKYAVILVPGYVGIMPLGLNKNCKYPFDLFVHICKYTLYI